MKRLPRLRHTLAAWAWGLVFATTTVADEDRATPQPPPARADANATEEANTKDGSAPPQSILVVIGAAGEPAYGEQFARWAEHWQRAAEAAGSQFQRIGGEEDDAEPEDADIDDRIRLQQWLGEACQASPDAAGPLWLVLIGHGTFAANVAKFNLIGPDVSAEELAQWLEGCRRPLVVVNCASASGPFMPALKGPDRVVVTATQSGAEQNFARFGGYLAESIGDPAADLDHDNAVSILEAYLAAAAGTKAFYQSDGRLATEHPLLDDNGDGLGTPPDFFAGTVVVKRPQEDQPVDGGQARYRALVAHDQPTLSKEARTRRDELEGQLESLRMRKSELSEDAYYEAMETIAIELAKLYDAPVAAELKTKSTAERPK